MASFKELNLELQERIKERTINQISEDSYYIECINDSVTDYMLDKWGISVHNKDLYWDTDREQYVAWDKCSIDKDKLLSHLKDIDKKTFSNTRDWDMLHLGFRMVRYNSWSSMELLVDDESEYSSDNEDDESDEELVALLWEDEFQKLVVALEDLKEELLSDILEYIERDYDYYYNSQEHLNEVLEGNDYDIETGEIIW